MDPQSPLPPIVVGIGASAGGLAALKVFFANAPPDAGMVFVVVVHLSPTHHSHLAELLQPYVPFPVRQVTETVELRTDCVYVIPPNANLSAIDTHLHLSKLEEHRRDRAPIDHFFRTLAKVHDGHAVAVVLTGTGSDGALGVKEVSAAGGLVVVQAPEDAEYDAMPRSAVATGIADLILPLPDIFPAILRYVGTKPRVGNFVESEAAPAGDRVILDKMLSLVRSRTGRDFSRYKPATVARRIARRMQLTSTEDPQAYLEALANTPSESRSLSDDLLIVVTQFFRDPEAFLKLETETIPAILRGRTPADPVRVWSVGCATGEEAYSLAILFLEAAQRYEIPPPIQIFASDLHGASLARAQVQALPRDQQKLVEQAAAYLQGLKTAKARFTQTSSRGAASAGQFYLSRPGRARFEYDPPAQLLVVSDGRKVSVYDRRLKTFESYLLGATPLAIFLSRRIRLDDDVKVTRVTRSEGGFAIGLADARGQADGRLILDFDAEPLALRGWTVVDGQGIETRVRLSDLAPTSNLDPALFVLKDPRKTSG